MFRNRALEVKMVKNSKKPDPEMVDVVVDSCEGKVVIVATIFGRIVKTVCFTGLGYVLLDTFRQVVVTSVNKR